MNPQQIEVEKPRQYLSPEAWLRQHPGTIGRTPFYEALRRGELPHVRIGRRYLVPDDLLDLLLVAKRSSEQDLSVA